jgi:hypothetical protein
MKKLGLLALLISPAFAQQVQVAPDCTLGAVFTTTGNSSTLDNRSVSINPGTPCTLWSLTWSAQNAVTSLTINIEGAPDSAGTPGSFSSLASASTFPSGKLTYSAATAYSPWMRITVTAAGAGGLINAVLNGWREDQASISGGGGGGGSGCPGTIATPCVIAGTNGAASIIVVATSHAVTTISAATDVRLVAGTSGKTTHLTFLGLAWDNAATITIRQGTTSSTPCDTSTATIDGPYGNATLTGLFNDYGSDFAPLTTTSTGLDICAHFSTSVTGGGGASYSQF